MIGKKLGDVFPTIAREEFHDRLQTVTETGVSQTYRHFYQGDGFEAWVDASLVKVRDGVLMTFQDITQLVRQSEALNEARLKAEQALKIRDEFLANISHEIRTPLNSILGFAELLSDELTSPEQLAYATSIRGAGHTLLKLINNVLDLAKLDADQLEIEKQPTALTEVLGSLVSIIAARVQQKGLTFTFSADAAIPASVLTDSLRLTQILMNLCENAIKFTSQGKIEVKAWLVKPPAETATVAFCVTDTGIGIEAAKLPLIFNRYQQASGEITRRYGGTGLGLNIVRSLVERMGGTIRVTSEAGKGSTFYVEMPFDLPAVAPAPAEMSTAPEIRSLERPVTILLVEDNPYNQRVVESLVKRFAVTLIKANHGVEGLYQLRRKTVDLVLMDIQMPFMDGYTTTYHIRHTMGLTVPIVAVTANALTNERENCIAKGMNDYLAKPFTRQELMRMIVRYTQNAPTDAERMMIPKTALSQLNKVCLQSLYNTNPALLRDRYEAFEQQWPQQCQTLCESLATNQTASFQQLFPSFQANLNALGINHVSRELDHLNQHYPFWTSEERSQQINQLIDHVEEAITELKQLTEQVPTG